jgi:hypothetical protein
MNARHAVSRLRLRGRSLFSPYKSGAAADDLGMAGRQGGPHQQSAESRLATGNAWSFETPGRVDDRQDRLEKIEFLIGAYRMRYMHHVWQDRLPEAADAERRIDRLLNRWQRVRDRDIAQPD